MPYTRTPDGKDWTEKSLGSSLQESANAIMKTITERNIRYIDLQFTDVPGKLQYTHWKLILLPTEYQN